MALSDDQKALLRLLAQREQGYDDIAALMGIGVEEVRARVKDALAAVESENEAPPSPPPARPVEKTATPVQAPAEEKPEPTPRKEGPSLSKERRVLAIAGGLAAIVVVIVLLATGVIGGSGSSGSNGSSDAAPQAASAEGATEKALVADSKLTGAVLAPVDGSDASGAALFGKQKNRILLQVEASGLEPSPPGSAYTIWLYKSPKLAIRVGAVEVPEDTLIVQLQVPEEALSLVAAGVFDQISIGLTNQQDYKAEVERARKNNTFPGYTGTEVLRGPIQGPIADVAAKQGGKASGGG